MVKYMVKNKNKWRLNIWQDMEKILENVVMVVGKHVIRMEQKAIILYMGIPMKRRSQKCQNAEERRAAAQKTEYIESIKDVNDLVQFLFDHDVSGEDHDYEAEAAARERAKDLLGLVIK